MPPRFAMQTAAAARVAASTLASAESASPRERGGPGNAGGAAAVKTRARDAISWRESRIGMVRISFPDHKRKGKLLKRYPLAFILALSPLPRVILPAATRPAA